MVAAPKAVSVVLVYQDPEEAGAKQWLVYYVSKTLTGARCNYIVVEKLLYGVLMASRKLRRHPIYIPSKYPLRNNITSDKALSRVLKWVTELGQYDLKFVARKPLQAGILADFVVEWTPNGESEMQTGDPLEDPVWTIQTDGAWGASRAGCSTAITSPSVQTLRYSATLAFQTMNNAAEYEGILLGLWQARTIGAQRVLIFSDSQLASEQLAKNYQARDPELAKYIQKVREMDKYFLGFEVRNIRRSDNEEADALAKAAVGAKPLQLDVLHETLRAAAITEGSMICNITTLSGEDWRAPICAYLKGRYVTVNRLEEQRLQHRCRGYVIHDGILYKGGVCEPLLRCLSKAEGEKLLKEIHEGLCSSHLTPRVLVAEAFRQGFYWPTAIRDAESLVRVCPGGQWMGRQSHLPATALQPIPPVWLFARWCIDIVGPLPTPEAFVSQW